MYTKDLANLLHLLQTSRQNGDLSVEPLEQEKIPWQGCFRLVDGQITSCWVRNKADGQILLRGDEAVRQLTNPSLGKLEWSLKEDNQPTETFLPLTPMQGNGTKEGQPKGNGTKEKQPKGNAQDAYASLHNSGNVQNTDAAIRREQPGAIPKRARQPMNQPSNALSSRDHRQVFSLIDGHRSIEEIARLLHKPPDFIARLLSELKAMGIID